MKYATHGIRVVEVHEPEAGGTVRATVWRVAPANGVANPPLVDSYVNRTPPRGTPCWRFARSRVRVGKHPGYERIAEGEVEFSAFQAGGNIGLIDSSDLEGLIVVLPRLWGATDTMPPALADLRANDDRLLLTYTAVDWTHGHDWKARWTMYSAGDRNGLVDSRTDINQAYNQALANGASTGAGIEQPAVARPSAPSAATHDEGASADGRPGWRADLEVVVGVGGLTLAAASAIAAAVGPGRTSLYFVAGALCAVGLLAFALYWHRYGAPRRSAVSRRARWVTALVALFLAVGIGVWLATRNSQSWAQQADSVCIERGQEYLNASGAPVQRAQRRLSVTQEAMSELQRISVPADVLLGFGNVLHDHQQVVGYLKEELKLAREHRSTTDVEDGLQSFYADVYMPDATNIGLYVCGQGNGMQ